MTGTNKDLFHKLFEVLLAEDEGEWFSQCYVMPESFEQISGLRSCIVFGSSGAGKTALCKALHDYCGYRGEKQRILAVDWKPKSLPADEEGGSTWVREQITVLFDECSFRVLEFLMKFSSDFDQAPDWIKVRLGWFLQKHILGNASLRLGPLLENDLSAKVLKTLLEIKTDGLFYEHPSPELAVKELLVGLKFFGLDGIWIIADDIQEWTAPGVSGFKYNLTTFLSMLSIFENSGLAFKFILPNYMEQSVAHASGLVRRRLDKYKLTWNKDSLKEIIEKRLAFITGKERFQLDQLCNDPDFENWLIYFGGNEPREWLELVSPFIRYYLDNSFNKPIPAKIAKELRLNNPPRFHLDEKGFRVKIGGRVIPLNDLPPKVYSLLSYLYRHAGEVVTKEQLFYVVDRELETVPARGDENYVDPISYAGQIDTNIYRLRQVIEPDPRNPVILQTERGYGVRLAIKW